MARRVLIVGGAGFIGSHLAQRCLAEGDDVHLLLRPSSDAGRVAGLLTAVTVHRVDLGDAAAARSCLARARPSHIFHLAGDTGRRHDSGIAQASASVGAVAALMTLIHAAAEAADPPRLFLRTGSIAEYGAVSPPFRETLRERPATGYAAAMVAGTHYAQAVAGEVPFPIVTARLALIYGSGQAGDFLVPSMIADCLAGRAIDLRRPLDRRDILHVDDAVEALFRLADTTLRGGTIVNIGSGRTIGVAELAMVVTALAHADPACIRTAPQADPVTLQLAIDRIGAFTGWRPRVTLIDGLTALIADMRRARAA